MRKVEVILPVAAIKSVYTYLWHDESIVPEIGMPVVVPFGKKQHVGIIVEIHEREVNYNLKPVRKVLSKQPLVKQWQIKQWEFIANRYCVPVGLVMEQAVPPFIRGKVQKQWWLIKQPEPRVLQALSYEAYPILKAIVTHLIVPMTEEQLTKLLHVSKQTVKKYLNLLKKAGIVTDQYEVLKAGKTRKIAYKALESLDYEQLLKRSPKQKEAYLWLLERKEPIPREEIPFKMSILKNLIDKGLVEEITWFGNVRQDEIKTIKTYNDEDFLLDGRFKDRMYIIMEHIEQYLREEKQVLILVPTIEYMQAFLDYVPFDPDQTGFYAYSLTPAQRKKLWEEVYSGRKKLIIGTRSALFLPWTDLSLIVFEEPASVFHENTAKTPHFHAMTVVEWLENYFNARTIYSGTQLNTPLWYIKSKGHKRSLQVDTEQADIWLADLRYAPQVRKQENPFTSQVWTLINETINGKILILVGRKGFTSVSCTQCEWTAQCPVCKIPLRFVNQRLKCEFCGYAEKYSSKCPQCGGETVRNASLGPERITEEIRIRFPEVPIYTISPDITPQPAQRKAIIDWFNQQENAIIVGTYPVLNALLHKPVDLAIVQNLYTILKVSGYGVKDNALLTLSLMRNNSKKLVIQTYDVEDPLLISLMENKPEIYFSHELELRKTVEIPPFKNFLLIELGHKDSKMLQVLKDKLVSCLKMQGLKPLSDISSIRRGGMRWATILIKTDRKPEEIPMLSTCLNDIYRKVGKNGDMHVWFNPVSK